MPESLQPLENHSLWIAAGVLVLLLTWEGFRPFLPFFRGKAKQRAIHLLRNTVLGVINAAMTSLGFVLLWAWAADWAWSRGFGLLNWISLSAWMEFAIAVLLLDFWTYWWHRWNHRVPFLWRFHRVHHADPRMDVTTANRFHFGEIILSSLLRVPVLMLIGAQLWHLAIYETLLFAVVQFHHANVALPPWLDRGLRIVTVTPAMHKVHHSRIPSETDSNYTSLFSIWDRLFGSFRLRRDLHGIDFGLNGYDSVKVQTVWGMAKTPFQPKPEDEPKSE
ncbi:MAG: sterol desaturase family protein [Verrucomicrobiales bacterium]|nr:sterol desaturase family protein [Verrucomicrobiales bacterium]